MTDRNRTLSREVTATQIPSGDKTLLPANTSVMIHQTLGGSYTVQTDFGLFRIDGKDGDALGETIIDNSVQAATLAGGAPDPAAVWDQLKKVYDPEIPVNIVDLGLVYSMDVVKKDDATYKVEVAMTLTAPGSTGCYVVTSRRSYPRDHVPTSRLFRSDGPSRLVMIVCSGRRLGPGNWLRRTVWTAYPASTASSTNR